MIHRLRIIAYATCVAAATLAALGQAPVQVTKDGPQPYRLQVNAQVVLLDVVVTDKQGNVVTGLGKDDFTVYEDKVPQPIISLEAPASQPPGKPPAINSTLELDQVEPDAPVTIIVLDEINTRFEDEAFTRYSLKKYLDSLGETLPQPTLLVATDLKRFMMLSDYTTSRKAILDALDHHLAAYPFHLQSGSWKAEQYNAAFASLMEVAEATAGHPGHKSMIWIGRGFPSLDPASLSAGDAVILQNAIDTCTNALRDARVVLYTLDPEGLQVTPPAADENGFTEEDPFGGQINFNTMASATGGHAFFGRNDVDHLIAESSRDAGAFYTLSYKPSANRTDAKAFHNIRVVVKGPGLQAVTREGYYTAVSQAPEQSFSGKLTDREKFDLETAVESTMIYDAVPLTLVRNPSDPAKFSVSFDSSLAPWRLSTPGKLHTDFILMVQSFDKKGKVLFRSAKASMAEDAESSVPGVPQTPKITLQLNVPDQPPAARLRFVVRIAGNQKMGSANIFLVNPATLSDPILGRQP